MISNIVIDSLDRSYLINSKIDYSPLVLKWEKAEEAARTLIRESRDFDLGLDASLANRRNGMREFILSYGDFENIVEVELPNSFGEDHSIWYSKIRSMGCNDELLRAIALNPFSKTVRSKLPGEVLNLLPEPGKSRIYYADYKHDHWNRRIVLHDSMPRNLGRRINVSSEEMHLLGLSKSNIARFTRYLNDAKLATDKMIGKLKACPLDVDIKVVSIMAGAKQSFDIETGDRGENIAVPVFKHWSASRIAKEAPLCFQPYCDDTLPTEDEMVEILTRNNSCAECTVFLFSFGGSCINSISFNSRPQRASFINKVLIRNRHHKMPSCFEDPTISDQKRKLCGLISLREGKVNFFVELFGRPDIIAQPPKGTIIERRYLSSADDSYIYSPYRGRHYGNVLIGTSDDCDDRDNCDISDPVFAILAEHYYKELPILREIKRLLRKIEAVYQKPQLALKAETKLDRLN